MSVPELQARLAAAADPKTREWWEAYLKGAARFRGVKMSHIRAAVRAWAADARPAPAVAYELFAQPHAEDKLAGVLLLREVLFDELDAREELPRIAAAFDAGHIADWSACDWLCVKLLAALVERDGVGAEIAAWVDAPGLWRRRAALVSFAPLAPRADDALAELVLTAAARLAADPERFAQTAIGWTLRELSKAHPQRVQAFADGHDLSREARRMALAKLPGGRGGARR